MFVSYLPPVAPAAILLLSALLLSVIIPRIPLPRQGQPWLQYSLAPGLVGVVLLSFLGVQLDLGQRGGDSWANWPLSVGEPLLNFRIDRLGFPFLILTLLLLLVVALMTSPFSLYQETDTKNFRELAQVHWHKTAGWLFVGTGVLLGLVSANFASLAYTILAFDLLLVVFWLKHGQYNLAIARLFLGVFSASAIALGVILGSTETASPLVLSVGEAFVGGALWLRLALFPFIEITGKIDWQDEEDLIYFGLSLLVGLYLMARTMTHVLPESLLWLTTIMMVVSGLLAWLADRISLQLSYLIIVEILLLLLVGPLPAGVIVAAGLSLMLSLVALWVTPHLGRPNLAEPAWLWLYLPAATATLTLIGLPFFLSWPVRIAVYEALVSLDNILVVLLALLAEMLAFTVIIGFWKNLWQDENGNRRRLIVDVVVMVPFLLPGLGLFIVERITQLTLPRADSEKIIFTLIMLFVVMVGALALHSYREKLLLKLNLSTSSLIEFAQLQWFWSQSADWLGRAGKLILRMNVVLEGQHYVGWAIFATIIGALIILLRV